MICQLRKFGVSAFDVSDLCSSEFGKVGLGKGLDTYGTDPLHATYVYVKSYGGILLPRSFQTRDLRL